MVEVFDGRIEFTNPGNPLVPIDRILDMAPRTRNDAMASFLHKCGICEERGSGYDKIVGATCRAGLLAPRVQDQGGVFTKVTIHSKVPIKQVGKQDRIWTCYMLACLACVSSDAIGNADVRAVFDLEDAQRSMAGRIISDTLKAGLIRPVDPSAAPKVMRYLPFWA
jgi:predicted HTH transcriptional regulator